MVELGQRAQQCDSRVEMRAGPELDEILAILLRVRQSHEAWNAEVMSNVKHPELAAGFGKLASQLADIGVVELTDVQFRPLQFVVPPDGVGIPLHQLEKALDNGFSSVLPAAQPLESASIWPGPS